MDYRFLTKDVRRKINAGDRVLDCEGNWCPVEAVVPFKALESMPDVNLRAVEYGTYKPDDLIVILEIDGELYAN